MTNYFPKEFLFEFDEDQIEDFKQEIERAKRDDQDNLKFETDEQLSRQFFRYELPKHFESPNQSVHQYFIEGDFQSKQKFQKWLPDSREEEIVTKNSVKKEVGHQFEKHQKFKTNLENIPEQSFGAKIINSFAVSNNSSKNQVLKAELILESDLSVEDFPKEIKISKLKDETIAENTQLVYNEQSLVNNDNEKVEKYIEIEDQFKDTETNLKSKIYQETIYNNQETQRDDKDQKRKNNSHNNSHKHKHKHNHDHKQGTDRMPERKDFVVDTEVDGLDENKEIDRNEEANVKGETIPIREAYNEETKNIKESKETISIEETSNINEVKNDVETSENESAKSVESESENIKEETKVNYFKISIFDSRHIIS